MRTSNLLRPTRLAAALLSLMAVPAFAAPAPTLTELTVIPTPIVLSGDAVEDVVFKTHTDTDPGLSAAVDAGKVNIEMATSDGVTPAPAGVGAVWVQITPFVNPTSGNAQFAVDMDGLGAVPGTSIGFRAHFVGQGPAVSEGKSDQVDVEIEDGSTCEGFNISADRTEGNGSPAPGNSGPWAFRIRLENCTGVDLYNVKAQGGSNGWAPMQGEPVVSAGNASVRQNKNNQVITWNLDLPSGATETIDVTVDGKIPKSAACDSIRYLSGAWSAVYDAGLGAQKSDYTGRVSLQVTCPAP